jgi:hypothetical protein
MQARPPAPRRTNAAAIVITIFDHVAGETHTNTMISIAIKPLQGNGPPEVGHVISFSFFFAMFTERRDGIKSLWHYFLFFLALLCKIAKPFEFL